MITKSTSFARYSKNLCWVVALIWLALSILTFTGGGENSTLNGVLWLLGAAAFVVSAMFLGRDGGSSSTVGDEQSND